ncbi:MAG: ECF transporter S component [Nitrososphaeria archaeon]
MNVHSRSKILSLTVILGAIGGVVSVPIGYAGRMLSIVPGFSLFLSQALSGFHVFWLVLAAALIKKPCIGITVGALKGLVELSLGSHLGLIALIISLVEGFFVDITLLILGGNRVLYTYLAGGFSSASNVIVLRMFLLTTLPIVFILVMSIVSFISGLVFGGYLSSQSIRILLAKLREGG